MKNKTVVISTYDDILNPHYRGGGALAVHELAKRLKNIYDVKVLTWNHTGNRNEVVDGVKYERIGVRFLSPKIAMLAFQIALPLIVQFKKFDIWLESFSPPFTTSFLPVFTNKKIVGVVHMLAAEDMKRKYKILPFHRIEDLGLKQYKNVIVTNKFLSKKIKNISSKTNITVISNGIDKVNHKKRKTNKNILYLGRVEIDQKGLDLLLMAYKAFREKSEENYQLVIAGSGTKEQIYKLKALIKQIGLNKHVHLVGWVSGKEKETLLKNSAVMVIPSRFETYSIVALEAMAFGLPIVCFDIHGLSWISGKAALKIEPYDVDKYADAIAQILVNKRHAKSFSEYGPVYARRYTWDNVAKKYHLFIGRLISI